MNIGDIATQIDTNFSPELCFLYISTKQNEL